MHDSHTAESPIPGERQVFSRPADLEAPNGFLQTSYSGGGLPPLPEFPVYSAGSAVQSGMSNPLFAEGEESSPDVADDSEQQAQPSSQTADSSHSQPNAEQPQAAQYAYSSNTEAATAAEGQDELALTGQDSGADDYGLDQPCPAALSSTAESVQPYYAAASTAALPRHSSDTAPYMSTASGQSADTAAVPNSLPQAPSYSQQASAVDYFVSPSRSARSTTEMQSPSPATPTVVDSTHGSFQLPGSQVFAPAHLPVRRLSSQTSALSQRSTLQASSSAQLASQQAASHSSTDMPHMQPAAMHGVYQDGAEEQQSYASRREVYGQGEGEGDYYQKQAAAASRPASAQRRQAHGRSHPEGPYSPMPGRACITSSSQIMKPLFSVHMLLNMQTHMFPLASTQRSMPLQQNDPLQQSKVQTQQPDSL